MPAIGIAVLVLALVIGGMTAFTYSGVVDVSADGDRASVSAWWLGTVRGRSVTRAARDVDVQLPVLTADRMHVAITAYDSMCADCHAPPGHEPSALAQGLNPAPPDLSRAAAGHPPAELFWVTRHGIRMTGMPAWGPTHPDDALWELIALVMLFPNMNGDDYRAALAAARAAGVRHDHDHDHHHEHDHAHDAVNGWQSDDRDDPHAFTLPWDALDYEPDEEDDHEAH
jgi:mono/diheme cytochrome c family protein